jgi:hypothetical protein
LAAVIGLERPPFGAAFLVSRCFRSETQRNVFNAKDAKENAKDRVDLYHGTDHGMPDLLLGRHPLHILRALRAEGRFVGHSALSFDEYGEKLGPEEQRA